MSYTPYGSASSDTDIDQTAGEIAEAPPDRSSKPSSRIFVLAVFGLALVIVLGLVAWLLSNRVSDPAKGLTEEARVGYLAPDFALVDVRTNQTVTLSLLRGKPVWINFWATWCPPCREEMPEMQQLYEQHKAQGLVILGVDVQEKKGDVLKFIDEGKFTWPFVIDADGKLTDRYLIVGMPSHYFVDRHGIIRAVHVGGLENMMGLRAPVDEYLGRILTP